MLQISFTKRILILSIVLIGMLFAFPNFFYSHVEKHNDYDDLIEIQEETATKKNSPFWWPNFLPSRLVNLGLDLRGGAHLLAEVEVEEVYNDRMDTLWLDIRDALKKERAKIGSIRKQKGNELGLLRIRISKEEGLERALEIVEGLAVPVASAAAIGSKNLNVAIYGDELLIQFSDAEKLEMDDRTMKQSLEIIRRRVDEVGTREPTIQRQGKRRILIQVPGIGSASELKSLIGTTARLTFQEVVRRTSSSDEVIQSQNKLYKSYNNEENNEFYVLKRSPVVTGEDLTDAQPSFDQNGFPSVNFRFNPSGAK